LNGGQERMERVERVLERVVERVVERAGKEWDWRTFLVDTSRFENGRRRTTKRGAITEGGMKASQQRSREPSAICGHGPL
jgi:hypothetical protein